MLPSPIPHGRTAKRLDWVHLPPRVRDEVERRIGTTVVHSISQDSGFTPGFASVLLGEDGTRHFVKAASVKAQRAFAEAYRIEARRLRSLPPEVAAPRLLWTTEVEDWVVLETAYVDGRAPSRPWTAEDLAAVSDMLVATSVLLTPAPGIGLDRAVDDLASWVDMWDSVDRPHTAECRALASRFGEVVDGDTLVHTDVRDDNLLITRDGEVSLCDWNFPVVGAAWLDSLWLLIGPRGDGLDVEAHIAAHPLLSSVPAESIDVVLALILGYLENSSTLPVPPTSPSLRRAQRWQRDVLRDWLGERRDWDFAV
ncbi:phosphotransferase [Nocardioides montaniterrae]